MKKIEVYEFSELSVHAQLNAISKNMYHVRKVVENYILDIWADHLGEVEALLDCSVSFKLVDWTVFTNINLARVLNYESPSDVKYAIAALVKKAEDIDFYFTEELKKAQSLYVEGETYISFIRKFILSLDILISDWTTRVVNSSEYVLDCINGSVPCICCKEDLIPSDCFFDVDGNVVKIID